MITLDDFNKIDLKIATIKHAEPHPNADRLLVLKIDLGSEERQLVAGIRGHYTVEELIGKPRTTDLRPWLWGTTLAGSSEHSFPRSRTGRSVVRGKQIVVVANIQSAKQRGVESQGMLLAARDGEGIVILTPQKSVSAGTKVS